ncbi:MAG: NUDIX hydrolase [Alphaproteobacteria bacterium]|nr:NUDIX hydrolase [Alphaproteobacteria bacterium]
MTGQSPDQFPSPPDFLPQLTAEIWPRIKNLKPNGARPVPAATLILVDRSGKTPKVLMGKRSPNDRFMPSKFVFPGGRVDEDDQKMRSASELMEPVAEKLTKACGKKLARALALAGIRETYEETGLVIGKPGALDRQAPKGWEEFASHGQLPDLADIHFVARAITPPRISRRYDTIFLAADADAISHRVDGAIGPDKELVELVWTPISQTIDLELPMITRVVLQELEWRMKYGMPPHMPVPWYGVQFPKGWSKREL